MTGKALAQFEIATPEDMHEFGFRLASILSAGDLLVLVGPLGAGKTTLSRGIGEGLNVVGNVSSPTFVIARTHSRLASESEPVPAPLVHVDAYRLGGVEEFDDLDIDFANSITLVEWGRGFAEGVVASWLDVEIDRSSGSDLRVVTLVGHGPRWSEADLSAVVPK